MAPGLGFLYIGRPRTAVAVNVAVLGALAVAATLVFRLGVFFGPPLAVLILGWLLINYALGGQAARSIEEADTEYVLKPYNQWLIYVLFALFTFYIPIIAGANWVSDNKLRITPIETSAMYPTLLPGDSVSVRLTRPHTSTPTRGELVALKPPGEQGLRIRRVVAGPGDDIRLNGSSVYVNGSPVKRGKPRKPEPPELFEKSGKVESRVESVGKHRYMIATSPRVLSQLSMEPTTLGADEYFVLADNRGLVPFASDTSKLRDSRHFGPVERKSIKGAPQYVTWSVHPKTGQIRQSRIGVKLQ